MIRILLVSDVVLVRTALAAALSGEADMQVVADVSAADAVLESARSVRPDVAVIDLNGSPAGELMLVRDLVDTVPGCSVVAVAATVTRTTLRSALQSRVRGFVSKQSPFDRLVEAIRRVAQGGRAIDPVSAVAAVLRTDDPFTPREREVLRLAAEGLPVAEIADRLHLTAGTVRNYVSSILHKVGARSRVEAIRTAERSGWL
jgi:two-component system, NarL family, response regulator DesR